MVLEHLDKDTAQDQLLKVLVLEHLDRVSVQGQQGKDSVLEHLVRGTVQEQPPKDSDQAHRGKEPVISEDLEAELVWAVRIPESLITLMANNIVG